MKKLLVLFGLACSLIISSCSKKDTRNIIIGWNYTVVATEEVDSGNANLIPVLFGSATKVLFKMKRDQMGTISAGSDSYEFTWKYATPGYSTLEIEFQGLEKYNDKPLVKAALLKMSGKYNEFERTNGLRVSPHTGIDMSNGRVQIRMAKT